MFDLIRDIRDLARLEHILLVFFEEGWGYYIRKSKLSTHLPFHKKIVPVQEISTRELQAQALRLSFERLGPTFLKLGQLLSQRPDLVPAEFVQEFARCQDQVPPFPFNEVKLIVEHELHKPLSSLFKHFDEKPIAAASIAQVHKAQLPNGKIVAVKVQRPQVENLITRDLDILFYIAHTLEERFPEFRPYRPLAIVKEFALWTRRELNFEVEASNAERLREAMKKNVHVKIPRIYEEYTSPKVLTMEYVEGIRLDDLKTLHKDKINPAMVAQHYFDSILEQALLHGIFHADPHPGNIFVQKKGVITYLDFGIVGELSTEDRQKVVHFLLSLGRKNADKSLDILISLAKEGPDARIPEFKQEVLPELERLYHSSLQKRSIGQGLYKILLRGGKYGLLFDPNHILMAKAIYQAEGIGLTLNPHFKIAEGLIQFTQKYLRNKNSITASVQTLREAALTAQDLLWDLPSHLRLIVHHLEQPHTNAGALSENQFAYLEEEMDYLFRKRNYLLSASLLFIASAALWHYDRQKEIAGIPFSVIVLIIAIILLLCYFLSRKRGHSWREQQ